MEQTRMQSLVEVCLNTFIGFWISFAMWPLVALVFAIPYTVSQNFGITAIFTITSIARSYVIRRWFNNGLHQAARKITLQLISWRA